MALTANELYAETSTTEGPQMRPYDAGVERVTFAAAGAAATYAPGTPVARNSSTGHWVVWANAGLNGTNVIRGFVYPRDVNVETGGEVIGLVMLRGEILYEDVVLPTGELQANLDTALKAIYNTTGITDLDVRELDGAK